MKKAVKTQSINEQAEADIAKFPQVKEEKPADSPPPVSKAKVDSLFTGWMKKTDGKMKRRGGVGFKKPPPQMFQP